MSDRDKFGNFSSKGKIAGIHTSVDAVEDSAGEEIFRSNGIRKIKMGFLLPFLLFVLVFYKLFLLQVQEGFVNRTLAEGNRIKTFYTTSPRGAIIDSKGLPLVKNVPSYILQVSISQLPRSEKEKGEYISAGCAEAELSKEEVIKTINNSQKNLDTVAIKKDISRDEALYLKSKIVDYPAFEVTTYHERSYEALTGFQHVVGYIGKPTDADLEDNPQIALNGTAGKSGLEQVYDEYLQGVPGEKKMEVDAKGHVVRMLSTAPASAGKTLQLSINKNLQKFAGDKLKEGAGENAGVVIIEDPKSGEIMTIASLPDYDNSAFSKGLNQEEYSKLMDDPAKPLFNRAIAGVYPAGSSIKPFIASGALEEGVVDENYSLDTPPVIEVGQWKFPDWKDHGTTDIRRAIAESNNIFFYMIGGGWKNIKGLGPEKIKSSLDKFGFDSKTGIDLDGEGKGFIPTPSWKERVKKEAWYIGNTYNMSIGQGDLMVTPIQIANATASIANGGTLYRPHLLEKVLNQDGTEEQINKDYKLKEKIYSEKTLNIVREGMRQTVTGGSAFSVFGEDFPIEVAAKTGTSQFGTEGKTHAWFTSYAPYNDPQLVVTVLVEGGGEGYQTAAPIAREIFKWWSENK